MGRDEEELRFRSARDQQDRWLEQTSGARKQNNPPLAPQLPLNTPHDDNSAQERGAETARQPAAEQTVAGIKRVHFDTLPTPPVQQQTMDFKPLVILASVAAAASIFLLMKQQKGCSRMYNEHLLSADQIDSIFKL